jgi:HK97 gp10 family phage protein
MDFEFEIKGLKELDDVLKTFPEKVQRRCIASACFAGATVWREGAKGRVPVRSTPSGPIRMNKGGTKGRLPGFLRASIRVWKRRGMAGGPTVSYGVGTRGYAFYGRFLEFGTSKMAARPWLRPAVDALAGWAVEAMRSRMEQLIKRYVLKGK